MMRTAAFHLHLGLDLDDTDGAQMAVREKTHGQLSLEFGENYFGENDGWNTWVERLGVDANDDRTLHAVIAMQLSLKDALYTADDLLETLSPWLRPHQDGIAAVLTTSDDWSESVNIYPATERA